MTNAKAQPGSLLWGGLMLLVAFLGLCTAFALVVTVEEASQEHRQERWPEVTARVDKCGLSRSSTGRRQKFRIRCRLSYAVGAEQHAVNFYSRSVPSPEIWQYPPNQIGPFEEWVDEHPQGTPIAARYDPADHTKAVLVTANAIGGPRTPSNLKLL